jgi:hypothetical protein
VADYKSSKLSTFFSTKKIFWKKLKRAVKCLGKNS